LNRAKLQALIVIAPAFILAATGPLLPKPLGLLTPLIIVPAAMWALRRVQR
jgi:hypothetical protein